MILRALWAALAILASAALMPAPAAAAQSRELSAAPAKLAGRGGEALQVEITGGFGDSLGTYTIWKRKGAPARLHYYNPKNRRALEAGLSPRAWHALQTAARHAAEQGGESAPDENANICMHPAGARIAMIDARGRSRKLTGDYCNPNPPIRFVDDLMQAFIEALPECRWVSPDLVSHAIERLQACTLLKGDLQTAGEALTWLDQLNFPIVEEFHAHWALEGLLNERVVASWARHSSLHGRDTIKTAIYDDFLGGQIWIDWVRGVSKDRVILEAIVRMPSEDAAADEKLVRLAMTINRTPSGSFELVRIAQR